jgi:hypothetical protein
MSARRCTSSVDLRLHLIEAVQVIAQVARELVQLRNIQTGTCTLTQRYNERPTWSDNAHRKLDTAVFAAYGWSTAATTTCSASRGGSAECGAGDWMELASSAPAVRRFEGNYNAPCP